MKWDTAQCFSLLQSKEKPSVDRGGAKEEGGGGVRSVAQGGLV